MAKDGESISLRFFILQKFIAYLGDRIIIVQKNLLCLIPVDRDSVLEKPSRASAIACLQTSLLKNSATMEAHDLANMYVSY